MSMIMMTPHDTRIIMTHLILILVVPTGYILGVPTEISVITQKETAQGENKQQLGRPTLGIKRLGGL